MKTVLKKLGLGAALAASALVASAPAEARDRYYGHRDNDAAVAIGAGILGLAVGAAIADSNDDRYYDRGYYGERRYVTVRGRPDYYYYYEGRPNRYYRDRYYDRYYAPYYRERYSRNYYGGSRGYYGDRRDWNRDRRDWHHDRRDWNRGDRYDRDDRRNWRR